MRPNAALLFYDYFLGDAQPLIAKMDYVPANAAVPSPMKGVPVKLVDSVQVLDQVDKWGKLYQDIVLRRA